MSIPWSSIAGAIAQAEGNPFSIEDTRSVGGGSINQAWRIAGNGHVYFVKTNQADRLDMFEAEAEGLREMAQAEGLRVPVPVCVGTRGSVSWIVMEHIAMGGGGRETDTGLGRALAAMHALPRERFGWHRDNTIGSTPQPNQFADDWVTFLRDQRLGFQFDLAQRNGHGGRLRRDGDHLLERLEDFFSDGLPSPSLLHGDLWGGNYAVTAEGEPCIFDPAVYYGDAEADMAMTELFGGFGSGFYAAYNEIRPQASGYPVRKVLYNLYHILNHLNLFGGGYLSQAESMTGRLLAEVK